MKFTKNQKLEIMLKETKEENTRLRHILLFIAIASHNFEIRISELKVVQKIKEEWDLGFWQDMTTGEFVIKALPRTKK